MDADDLTSFVGSPEVHEDECLSFAQMRDLQDNAALFHIACNFTNDPIVMIDSEARILFWNKAAERHFGYSVKEALGQNLYALVIPQRYRQAAAQLFDQTVAAQKNDLPGKTVEIDCVRKDGGEFPLELSLSAALFRDQWIVIGIGRDISNRKRAEQQTSVQLEENARVNAQLAETIKRLSQTQSQLLQSEKMASIGMLAAGVAHEINNPIGYVYSNLGALEKYLLDLFAVVSKYEAAERLMDCHTHEIEDLRQFKKRIDLDYLRTDIQSLLAESREGLMRVKKIVLDLKDFSHLESEEDWHWADVHQGLESTLSVVWNELKYKCEVVKEYGQLPLIQCLPSQLNQVFMNLLVNAAQAIDKHGVVTIRTGQEQDQVWVEVSDTGKGIAPDNLPRLFDPFFTTKPVGQGTGLGLSVSYSIVEKHHGRFEVHSEVGKGATFRVWLPVKQADLVVPSKDIPSQARTS